MPNLDTSPETRNPGVTRQLCAWIEGLTLEDIPTEIRTRAKYLILDGLGCAIVAAHLPWTEKATEIVLGMEGDGECAVWGYNKIQGFEIDDWHSLAPVHSNAIALPSLFAAASHSKAKSTDQTRTKQISGKSFLLSTITAYEIGPRVGLALYGSNMLSRGWHSGTVFGHAQAAGAVSKLLGLSVDRIEDALGIACTQACGLMAAQFGSDAKRMQHGFAARNGLFAALLAGGGYTGIKGVMEEEYGGFLGMFSAGNKMEPPFKDDEVVKGLGGVWQTEGIRVKPYAAMAGTHCTADTLAALQGEYPGRLGDLGRIKRIRVEMSEAAYKHGGWVAERPLSVVGAQMSCAYVAAVQLVDGQVLPGQFRPDLLDRDNIWEVVGKVECAAVDEFKEIHEQRATVEFEDGVKLSKYLPASKGVDPPMSNEEILQKYRTFTKGLISEERQRRIEEMVLDLECVDDVSELEELLLDLTASPFDI